MSRGHIAHRERQRGLGRRKEGSVYKGLVRKVEKDFLLRPVMTRQGVVVLN